MRLDILRVGPDTPPPFLSAADYERRGGEHHLAVLFRPAGLRQLGWWPTGFRTMLDGRLWSRRGRLLSELSPGELAVAEAGPMPELELTLGEDPLAFFLLPSRATLRQLVDPGERPHADYPVLFAAQYSPEHPAYGALHALAGRCRTTSDEAVDDYGLVDQVVARVSTSQAAFAPLVARCPGRRIHHKRELFARLQRVRALLGSNLRGDTDTDHMAAIANLSACHFIRVYKQVYQETPHRTLSATKAREADALLAETDRTVTEIGRLLGFDNRSAFARWYRQHAGRSASEARILLRSRNASRSDAANEARAQAPSSIAA